MKAKLLVLLIAVTCILFSYFCGRQARRYPNPFNTDRVPTFRELQEMVGAEPDGIIGPNTIAKWDRKICDQYEVESMNKMAGHTK